MDQFWEEYESGEIHLRDKFQFELKSDFIPLAGKKQSEYTQEFFFFIPNALQINAQTYSKDEFFRAETNLIRLQTPELSFSELLDPLNELSPLAKLEKWAANLKSEAGVKEMEKELKLFANIARKTLRNTVYPLIVSLKNDTSEREIEQCKNKINTLLVNSDKMLASFQRIRKITLSRPEGAILLHVFTYIQDVLSISINSTLVSLLEAVRFQSSPLLKEQDEKLAGILLREKKYREEQLKEPDQLGKNDDQNEAILYQSGLLNKFILDALQLKTERSATHEKYRSVIGSVAAALAMLLYVLLFIWQGAIFVINSLPFVLFSVILYVVKDRIKDELKNMSFKHMFKWFLDYTTQIYLPEDHQAIGKMQEAFTFLPEAKVPMDIQQQRSEGFHSHLDMIKRPEQTFTYKRKVVIYGSSWGVELWRGRGLNVIFRYDLHSFLTKGSDPYENYTTLDSETLELVSLLLPKVYHVNVVLKNKFLQADLTEKIEYKKYRIVVDKEGIKRIEGL